MTVPLLSRRRLLTTVYVEATHVRGTLERFGYVRISYTDSFRRGEVELPGSNTNFYSYTWIKFRLILLVKMYIFICVVEGGYSWGLWGGDGGRTLLQNVTCNETKGAQFWNEENWNKGFYKG